MSRKRSRTQDDSLQSPFIPSHAFLGYPPRFRRSPAISRRRNKFIELTVVLHDALSSVVGQNFFFHEELIVLTSDGFDGRTVRADCVAITDFCVFVITSVNWKGEISTSLEKNKVRVLEKPGAEIKIEACPLQYTVPAVHFLDAVLEGFGCPIESIAVSENEACEFGLGLSTSLLKPSELPYFFRTRRESARCRQSWPDIWRMSERLNDVCGPDPSTLRLP